MIFVTLLAVASFAGTICTLAYSTLIYAFTRKHRDEATTGAAYCTAATFLCISYLLSLMTESADAGGFAMHILFICTASIFGWLAGAFFFKWALERIELRIESDDKS
jgi:predicted permease